MTMILPKISHTISVKIMDSDVIEQNFVGYENAEQAIEDFMAHHGLEFSQLEFAWCKTWK